MALLCLLLGLTACTSTAVTAPAPETASPEAVPATTFGASGEDPMPIQAGTHLVERSAWSVVDFTVTFPPGWTEQYGHVYSKHPDEDTEFGLYAVILDEIYDNPCKGEGLPIQPGPSVDDLVTALQEQPVTESAHRCRRDWAVSP